MPALLRTPAVASAYNGSTGSTVTVTTTGSTQATTPKAGDLAVAIFALTGTSVAWPTVPADWTVKSSSPSGGGPAIVVATKRLTADGNVSVVGTVPSGRNTGIHGAVLVVAGAGDAVTATYNMTRAGLSSGTPPAATTSVDASSATAVAGALPVTFHASYYSSSNPAWSTTLPASRSTWNPTAVADGAIAGVATYPVGSADAALGTKSAVLSAAKNWSALTLIIPADTGPNVEHVATTTGSVLPGSGCWAAKPLASGVSALADDEPSTFRFTGQSGCRQRVTIQRFRGVHPTAPILSGPLWGANTATAATAHVAPDIAWSPRSMMAAIWSTASPLGTWTNPAGLANLVRAGGLDEHLVGTELWNAAGSSGTNTATYSASAVWNAGALVLRAADTVASGVEVLIAWHSMDAAQSSGTMDTPSWAGWTLLGTLTRISTSGASNIKVYMLVVKAPRDQLWVAATDVGSTATDGLTAGYTGTQRQQPGSTNVSNPAALPLDAAPFGRPGFAIRADIDAPPAQRAEHNPNHRQFINNDDYFFSFAFALPLGYPTWVNDFNVIEQIHAASDNGSPVVSFEVRDWSLRMRGGDGKPGANPSNAYLYNLLLVQNLRVGRWYHVVYRILFHEDPAITAVDVWVDATRLVDTFRPPGGTVYQDSIPVANGPGPSYRKQGIYKRTTIEGGGPGLQPWHAGSALGRSFAAVDPTRLHTPTTSPELFAASA